MSVDNPTDSSIERPERQADGGGLSQGTLLSHVTLGTKERKALDILGIKTVGQLLELDLRPVLELRGYGVGTHEKLRAARRRLRTQVHGKPDTHAEPNVTLQTSVYELDLNTRGRHALQRLDIDTIAEFLDVDFASVGPVRGCGETTKAQLASAQKNLRRQFSYNATAPSTLRSNTAAASRCREVAITPADPSSWTALPLFSGASPNGLRVADLHESYRPQFPVERLGLPKRARRALDARKISSVGELLLTPGPELIGSKKLGPGTLSKTQSIVTDFLLCLLDSSPALPLDTSSPEAYLSSLLDPVVKHARQKRVLLERLGWRSNPKTLEELAIEYGVTRERIRQLEKAGLRKLFDWQGTRALRPLHDFIEQQLRSLSPLTALQAVGRRLQNLYGWDRAIHKEAIAKLLPAFEDLRCVDNRYVCLAKLQCPECPSLAELVEAVLPDDHSPTLDLADLSRAVWANMRTSGACANCADRPLKPSANLVRIVFRHDSSLRAQYRVVKHELWHVDKVRLASGHLSPAIEVILRKNPKPMTYRQAHVEVNRLRQRQVDAEVVWHALNSCVAKGASILLWDRGGVYLHKDHVNLYLPVLNAVEKWVIAHLEEGVVPQISANAAFLVFSEPLIASGIISPYAVHSCLKHRQHPKLAFFHSPYIGLAGVTRQRIPNVEIAEDLIRQEGDVVPLERLKEVLCEYMGLKSFQFQQIISQFDNVVRTEHGFLHTDYFDSGSPAFRALIDHVQHRLLRESHLSSELVYAEKRISCLQLGIDGPHMLHSLLAAFAQGAIVVRPYPLLEHPSSDDVTATSTVRDRVVQFIAEKRRPVSCEELRKKFVSKLGFNSSTVMAAASTDVTIRYLVGIVVHRDTIEWSPSKQGELVSVAKRYFAEQVSTGTSFARADLLLELHEHELPPLGNDVIWTSVLLAELLDRDNDIGIFGNRRNAYFVNTDDSDVWTFGGFVRHIVHTRFKGACGFAELSEFLRDSKVVAKQVTPKMLEGEDRLTIGKHELVVE